MERSLSALFARFEQGEQQRPGDEFADDVLLTTENDAAEITPYDVRSRRFGRTLLGGLKAEEVTAFLDEVAEALHIAQSLHIEMGTRVRLLEDEVQALTIKQQSVAPSDALRGAERQATSIIREDEEKDDAPAANRLELLRSTALQEVEALLHDAQARAQASTDAAHEHAATILREADALRSQRQMEADRLVAEATATAESILMTARDQEAALRHELDRLAETRLRMLDDMSATLNAYHEWLATVDPRRRGPEEQEGRLDRVA